MANTPEMIEKIAESLGHLHTTAELPQETRDVVTDIIDAQKYGTWNDPSSEGHNEDVLVFAQAFIKSKGGCEDTLCLCSSYGEQSAGGHPQRFWGPTKTK